MSYEDWEGAHGRMGIIVLAVIGCLFLWDLKTGGCVAGAGMNMLNGRDAAASYYECQGTKSEAGAAIESTFKQAAVVQRYLTGVCEQSDGSYLAGESKEFWGDIRTDNKVSVCSCLGALMSQPYMEHEVFLPTDETERPVHLQAASEAFLKEVTTTQLDDCI